MESFGERLKRLRKSRGWSQDVLAEKLGLQSGKQIISNWETGRTEPPLGQLRELTRLFEINLVGLIEGDERPIEPEQKPGYTSIPTEEYIELLRKAAGLDQAQEKGNPTE